MIEGLERHARGQGPLADDGHHAPRLSATRSRDGHPERRADGTAARSLVLPHDPVGSCVENIMQGDGQLEGRAPRHRVVGGGGKVVTAPSAQLRRERGELGDRETLEVRRQLERVQQAAAVIPGHARSLHLVPVTLALNCIVAQDWTRAGRSLTSRERASFQMDTGNSSADFQDRILPYVSRTFALTIPQLPKPLRIAVTNAYLLCRIADTIEDEPALPPAETRLYLQRFTAVVRGTEPAVPLARELARRLSERTLPAERELVNG